MIENVDWIAALRSGEYSQTKKQLRTSPYHYCCLGVRCDLLEKAGEGEWVGDSFEIDGYESDTNSPDPVWLNSRTMRILEETPLFEPKPGRRKDVDDNILAGLNDDGFTFSQIADLIDHFQPHHINEEG